MKCEFCGEELIFMDKEVNGEWRIEHFECNNCKMDWTIKWTYSLW